MKLSANARVALRRAITTHSGWDAHRKANGLSLATMSRDDYFAAARALGLDIAAIARAADNAPAPLTNPKTDEAREIFDTIKNAREQLREMPSPLPSTDEVLELNRRDHAETARRMAERPATVETVTGEKDAKADKLLRLIAEIAGAQVDEATVERIARAAARDEMEKAGGVVTIEMVAPDRTVKKLEGKHHPKFPALMRAATARDVNGFPLNIWVSGPAGSGKTYSIKAVAAALECPFYFNGAVGMVHELLGFTDANGEYHRTPFREAYENGGVYVFDEVDGSDNAAILALNAALANGVCAFPDATIERHVDCRIFATANTWGHGATSDYVGRAKLDAAFLDRFAVKFDWQYDEELERGICGNPEFAFRVQKARAAARSAGLKVVISPRASIAGAALLAQGFTADEAAQMTYLAPLSPEQKRMVEPA